MTCVIDKEFANEVAQEAEPALGALLDALKRQGYTFVTPTPETHRRVLARRADGEAHDLRDLFGWSLPFREGLLDARLLSTLRDAGLIERAAGGLLRSCVRVSSLGRDLFAHSAFPTDDKDAVFFGPDSYRFAAVIAGELGRMPGRSFGTVVDIGTGSGVGAVAAARLLPEARLIGTDVNRQALRFAAANAAAAGLTLEACRSATLAPVDGPIDLALANPPYMIDEEARDYRHGGASGIEVALRMTADGLDRLADGGMMILYTGTPIVAGEDALRERLVPLARTARCRMSYRELDPDVFGEELAKAAYRDVERIAVVAAVFYRGPETLAFPPPLA